MRLRHLQQLKREYKELFDKSKEALAAMWRARDELREMQQSIASMPFWMRRGHTPHELLRRQRGSSSIVPGFRHLEEEGGRYNRMIVYTRLLQERVRQREKENKEAHDLLHNKLEEIFRVEKEIKNLERQHTESDSESDSEYSESDRNLEEQYIREREAESQYLWQPRGARRRQQGARFFVHAMESMA